LGGGEGEKRLIISVQKRKIGKPTRRICVRSMATTISREREVVEESDSDGREFLTFENRTKS
jgi:hypothetical protein